MDRPQVGQRAYQSLKLLPETSVEVVAVEGDGVVTNADIILLAQKFDALHAASPTGTASSHCMAPHVAKRHSPLSYWNYIAEIDDSEMPWVPDLTCQFGERPRGRPRAHLATSLCRPLSRRRATRVHAGRCGSVDVRAHTHSALSRTRARVRVRSLAMRVRVCPRLR